MKLLSFTALLAVGASVAGLIFPAAALALFSGASALLILCISAADYRQPRRYGMLRRATVTVSAERLPLAA